MFNLQDNKNKIALILTVFLLIILAFLVISLFFSGKGPSSQQLISKTVNVNQGQNSNRQSITQAQEKIVADNKETIETTDCNQINDAQQKNSCSNFAAVNSALSDLDYGVCEKLSQQWQDICIYKVTERASGERINQTDKCALIKDKLTRSMCYKYAAAMLNNVKLCDQDEVDKDECLGYTIDFNNQQGLVGCKNILSSSWFYACVIKNNGDCSVMKDKDPIAKCQSWQLFDKIIAGKQPGDCVKLPLENFRKVCEIALSGKGFIDSDGDGVNNYEELIFGTDPFVSSSDAKEIVSRENLVGSFASNLYDQTANNLSQLIINKVASSADTIATSTR